MVGHDYTTPHAATAALLTIDTQRDFTLPGAPAEIAGTWDVVPAMRRLVEAFRVAGRPLVHVVRLYQADGRNVDACRRALIQSGVALARPGSDGAELVEPLKPDPAVRLDAERLLQGEMQALGPGEWAMYKPRWSAFYQAPLDDHLRGLGVDTVVVAGCNFPNCPRATLYDASMRDYRLVMAVDAVSGVYERGLREMEGIGVRLLTTADVIDWLRQGYCDSISAASPDAR